MNEQQIKRIVDIVGISASVISVALIVGFSFVIYKNMIEVKRNKLQIKLMERDLGSAPEA